jgi:hypothetical protein
LRAYLLDILAAIERNPGVEAACDEPLLATARVLLGYKADPCCHVPTALEDGGIGDAYGAEAWTSPASGEAGAALRQRTKEKAPDPLWAARHGL